MRNRRWRIRPGLGAVLLIVTADLLAYAAQEPAAATNPPPATEVPFDRNRYLDLNDRVMALYRARRFKDAIPLAEEGLRVVEAGGESGKEELPGALSNLAQLYRQADRLPQAELMYRRAITVSDELGLAEDSGTGIIHDNLAALLGTTGRLDEADLHSARAVAILRAALGPDSFDLAGALNNRAILLVDQHRYDEAEPLVEEAIGMLERLLGADHPAIKPFRADLEEVRRRRNERAAKRPQ